MAELNQVLPAEAIVVADPGTPCPYFSAYFENPRTGRHFISNRAHGALGYSMSAAVGAHFGRPGAKVVAVMGDGSFGFTVGELETICRLKIPLAMVVISNSSYGWIKAGQKSGFGERYFSVDFSRTDHAAVARAFGVRSCTVEDPGKLREALAAGRGGRAGAGRRVVPAAAGGEGAGQRVDRLSSTNRRSRPRTVRNTSVSSTQ